MRLDGTQLLDVVQPVLCVAPPKLSRSRGLYALFVANCQDHVWDLLSVTPRDDRLLYIGVATTKLSTRYHPTARSSYNSSPRFSFGALLRDHLDLKMRPNLSGRRANWHFDRLSEDKLSSWMRAHLAYASAESCLAKHELKAEETKAIARYCPPLNIRGRPGGPLPHLIKARECCKRLALGHPQ